MSVADIGGTQNIIFNFSQLNNTAAITYRLYGVAEATNGTLRIKGPDNNIEINGTINTDPATICNVSDDFNSTPLGAEWTDVGGNATTGSNLTIVTNSATALDYVHQDVSNAYNTTLSSLANTITWEFNMRQSRGNPNGFDSGEDGVAFVLGATDSDLTIADGYAVLLGEGGGTDNIKFVSFTDGIDENSNLTDIITDTVDYGNEYLSIRVTYDPTNDNWELYVRNDGTFLFNSPVSLDVSNLVGTAVVNTTFTDISLDFIATVFNHGNNANRTATFDNICISTDLTCNSTVTWNGSTWSPSAPNNSTAAVINGNYNTNSHGNFTACSLELNADLTVENGDFIEVINDLIINDGVTLTTETQGSFVQRGNGTLADSFTLNGTGSSEVIKTTSILNTEEDYTYWSSPVENITIADGLTDANSARRYTFNANNFLDTVGNGVDDNADAWTSVTDTDIMEAGKGYISMHGFFPFPLGTVRYDYVFEGSYNTGDIIQTVPYNATNVLNHWNLLGNPYPSAIDTNKFFTTNAGVVDQVLYMWSHVRPADGANPGNEVLNFNQSDYITVNTMGTAGNGGDINDDGMIDANDVPSQQVPSGQSFFIASIASGDVLFTNSMRVSGEDVNTEFYRTTNSNTSATTEKLWLNLSSDIGIYSQICVAYSDLATDGYDGKSIDTDKNYAGTAGFLYSLDNSGNGFYIIQGKASSSLNDSEILKIGFGTLISTTETYEIALPQFQGNYLTNNAIFIRDNDLGIVHNLKESPYQFTSDGGVFENRFEIVFTNNLLNVEDLSQTETTFSIIEKEDDNVEFSISDASLTIETIDIFDLQGRHVLSFEGNSNTEVVNMSSFSSSIFISKLKLSNGNSMTKKGIKK